MRPSRSLLTFLGVDARGETVDRVWRWRREDVPDLRERPSSPEQVERTARDALAGAVDRALA